MDHPHIQRILLPLWQQRRLSLQALAAAAGLTPSQTVAALGLLAKRCRLEHTPAGVELVASAPGIWRQVLEDVAARRGRIIGRKVQVFQKTSSTNDACWAAAGRMNHGLVALADEQTAGRGRRGNPWQAKAGQSLLLSVLLREFPTHAETLTLLAGLAVARGLEAAAPIDCEIKWPNDVLIAGKKVAGILVEQRGGDVVIGIGVNVAQHGADFPPELRGRAGSLYSAAGQQFDRLEVLEHLLEQLQTHLFAPAEDWLTAWKTRCPMLGTDLEIRTPAGLLHGRVLDVDPLHGLALRDQRGATHWCAARTCTIGGA